MLATVQAGRCAQACWRSDAPSVVLSSADFSSRALQTSMTTFRALPEGTPATAIPDPRRACPECGSPVRSQRPDATYCGGRCRLRACRRRQRAELEERLAHAEAALAAASVAVAEFREVVERWR